MQPDHLSKSVLEFMGKWPYKDPIGVGSFSPIRLAFCNKGHDLTYHSPDFQREARILPAINLWTAC